MKKIMHSRAVTALLFLLALVLLSVGTIGGTQAALSIRSRDYDTSCRAHLPGRRQRKTD